MANTEERLLTAEEIRAQIVEAKRKKDEAQLTPRDSNQRRTAEHKQRKGRVNPKLLRGQGHGLDETWTIRTSAEHIRSVKALAKRLSKPGAKVSIAALMQEAIELLLANHAEKGKDAVEA